MSSLKQLHFLSSPFMNSQRWDFKVLSVALKNQLLLEWHSRLEAWLGSHLVLQQGDDTLLQIRHDAKDGWDGSSRSSNVRVQHYHSKLSQKHDGWFGGEKEDLMIKDSSPDSEPCSDTWLVFQQHSNSWLLDLNYYT